MTIKFMRFWSVVNYMILEVDIFNAGLIVTVASPGVLEVLLGLDLHSISGNK